MPLRPDALFPIAHVADDAGSEFGEHVMFDGASWFHVRRRSKQWLLHGTTMSSGSALYIFMDHPEARHAELEADLPNNAQASQVYADWLEEQGDPFGAALKPELAKARGPAGLWWLEGFERTGVVTVTMRDGFVREALVKAVVGDDLLSIVHRVCHLRACVALERLVIESETFGNRGWKSVFSWSMWSECRWPSSLKSLAFSSKAGGRQGPTGEELKQFRAKLAKKFPALSVEG